MSPECDDCGESFETFTDRRQHECAGPDANSGQNEDPAVQRLADLVEDAEKGDANALHQALAQYETVQVDAHETNSSNQYREISRTYRKPLIIALDDAAQAQGWPFLEEFIDAYHPDTSEEFPHVTTILQNVVSRFLIRTRLEDGVDAISVTALDYFEAILDDVGEYQDYIREALHPYGWGIGHPDRDVADTIQTLAENNVFLANPILEHAFYADQYAAIDVLERIATDSSIDGTVRGVGVSHLRYLSDAPAGAASDEFWPTSPRYWDWQGEFDFEFDLDDDVRQRVRTLVTQNADTDDLPANWTITDLTL